MDAEMRTKVAGSDNLAGHLASKLDFNEKRGGFIRVPWPVDPPKPVKRSSLRSMKSTRGKRTKPQPRTYAIRPILADEQGRLYGDGDVYKLPIAEGQPYRWATPQERADAGDRLVKAIVEKICPPERDKALGIS